MTDRELLANTPLDAARNDGELRRLGDYKKQLDAFYAAQDDLGAAENKLTEAWHSGDQQKIKNAQREYDRASAREFFTRSRFFYYGDPYGTPRLRAGRGTALTCPRQAIHSRALRVPTRRIQKQTPHLRWSVCFW